ncbi:SCRG1 protein, partial [Nothoprocta pentlandii]|nr:SCRG1 protein [Nothoprocta pentlandii]
MKVVSALPLLLLLSALAGARAAPAPRLSCSKRALGGHGCHGFPQAAAALRPVHESLQDHFWEGKGCETICYCSPSELLCCPKNIFFGPKISFLIPCNSD